jgi:hypothetical protein
MFCPFSIMFLPSKLPASLFLVVAHSDHGSKRDTMQTPALNVKQPTEWPAT